MKNIYDTCILKISKKEKGICDERKENRIANRKRKKV